MATLTDTGYPTLKNVVSRLRPDGGIETDIAEMLSKNNPQLDDIPWIEGNMPTGHRITSRTGLPSPTWRMLNQGVDPSRSDTAQFDETCGMLEAYSNVDIDLAKLNGNEAAFRRSEDMAQIEAISQEAARAIFYESVLTSPEKIHGLSARYAGTSGYTASAYVKKPGTTAGTNAQSIWLINWQPGKLYGIYPKGSVAGLKTEDLGKQRVTDSNSKQYLAYVSHYQWKLGIAVQDYRYAVRLQWDPDDSTNYPDGGKNLYLDLQDMLSLIQAPGPGMRFYMSRTSKMKLDRQLASNAANFLEYLDSGRGRIPSFMGTPIRITDALVGETAIS